MRQIWLSALESDSPKAIISDIRMPGMDGLALLAELKTTAPDIPVIITTAHSDLDSAVTSYESGAFEYLPKPFDIDEMIEVATRALAHTNKSLNDTNSPDSGGKEIIGNAPAMQEVFRAIGASFAELHYRINQRPIWIWQGISRPSIASTQSPSNRTLRRAQHGGYSERPHGVRAVWS